MKKILLTGSTGFLGKVILEKLTTRFPQSSIYCLVRPKNNATAKQRVHNISNKQNIIALEGNISKNNLGLSELDYQFCIKNIDVIVHCAASTKFNAPMKFLEINNIRATSNMLLLANEINVVRSIQPIFLYVSTAYQAGKSNTYIKEKFIHEPKLGFKNNYEKSKWITEQNLKDHNNCCHLIIVRPSIILADETGKCNAGGVGIDVFGLLYKKSKLIPSPVPLTKALVFDFVTVDYVASSIVEILSAVNTIPSDTIFHLTDVNGGMKGKEGIPVVNKIFGIKMFGVNISIIKFILKFLIKYTSLIKATDKQILNAYIDYFGTNPSFELKNFKYYLNKNIETVESIEIFKRTLVYWMKNINIIMK